jgi:type VI secretion system protein ImpI
MQLTLMINNTDALSSGVRTSAMFDHAGGMIGASETAQWSLTDHDGLIAASHLQVHYIDGHFCLEALTRNATHINGSDMALDQNEMVRITDGDTLKIGSLDIIAYVTTPVITRADKTSKSNNPTTSFISVGTLVGDTPEDFLINGNDFKSQKWSVHATDKDPIDLLDQRHPNYMVDLKDPLVVMQAQPATEYETSHTDLYGLLNGEVEEAPRFGTKDNFLPDTAASITLPFTQKSINSPMTAQGKSASGSDELDAYLTMLSTTTGSSQRCQPAFSEELTEHSIETETGVLDLPEDNIDHVLLRPLCHALGLSIQSLTLPQANRLAQDIGKALKAAITGLMRADTTEISGMNHLTETHLHAIEDNPLRRKRSVEDTVMDMFLIQSPVHLSPDAAISESLQMLHNHQIAVEKASEEALDTVLQALSPLALARRFLRYKGHAPRSGNLDAWHWSMYQHYYAEMHTDQKGGKQRGLSRMFREVYRQAYDREIRRLNIGTDQ